MTLFEAKQTQEVEVSDSDHCERCGQLERELVRVRGRLEVATREAVRCGEVLGELTNLLKGARVTMDPNRKHSATEGCAPWVAATRKHPLPARDSHILATPRGWEFEKTGESVTACPFCGVAPEPIEAENG